MSESKVIAVFGISGVGKSSLISQFVGRNPKFTHLQASALMRKAIKSQTGTSETLRTSRRQQILTNQNLLIDEFSKASNIAPNCHVIFDGHSIIDNDAGLVCIPVSVIKGLTPQRLIFLHDCPKAILHRRSADTVRMRPSRTTDDLEQHQKTALEVCEGYAQKLCIPLDLIRSGDLESFSKSVTSAVV